MGVTVIDETTFYNTRKKTETKFDKLKKDIQYIIENRIEYSEFTDFPYAPSTIISDIMRKVCNFVYSTYINRRDRPDIPLDIVKVKDEHNAIHVFCHFDLNKWDKLFEEE